MGLWLGLSIIHGIRWRGRKERENKRHMQAMANKYLLIETHMIEHMIIHNGDRRGNRKLKLKDAPPLDVGCGGCDAKPNVDAWGN